jgi:response regulator RpfG family c-di-GMP phosphodiesterase
MTMANLKTLIGIDMQPVVLLVDDEESIRSALHRMFRKNNFQVIEADSGQAALEVLAREVVDVIISDQRMPGMTGTELLAKVKKGYPDIGRIMLSGQSDFDDLCEAINEAKVHRFLSKPWDEEQLVNVVNDSVPSGMLNSSLATASDTPSADSSATQENPVSSRNNKVMAAIIKEAVLRREIE